MRIIIDGVIHRPHTMNMGSQVDAAFCSDSIVCGHHMYKTVWTPFWISTAIREPKNDDDRHAVYAWRRMEKSLAMHEGAIIVDGVAGIAGTFSSSTLSCFYSRTVALIWGWLLFCFALREVRHQFKGSRYTRCNIYLSKYGSCNTLILLIPAPVQVNGS